MRTSDKLLAVDPVVSALVEAEAQRRARTIDLIASESEPSSPVLEALGSVFAAKTAEGYPGRRYHRGTVHADEVEQLAIDRAKALFGADHANVQPSSGVNANLAVYRALLKPGDAVLSLGLAHGGHLSHGDPASITGAVYRFDHYGVRRDTETIDLDEVRDKARTLRPELIVTGGSSYPRAIDYAAFGAIAREVGARLLVDMAHIAGLVAAGELPSPFPHADAVTFTTYKTMLGPHGGVILTRADIARAIDRAVFPGTQGAPDFGRIAAKAVCFGVAATDGFRETQRRIRANAAALAGALATRGDRLVSGGTDNHVVLVDLRARGLTGDVAEVALEEAGVMTNRNVIPFDPGTPDRPSGLRLGTTAATQQGLNEAGMTEVAALIDEALRAAAAPDRDATLGAIRARAAGVVASSRTLQFAR
ncbi:MAG TPA: serine hydroxymethyltransferase [Candidatus Limnocylindria bacterium]|nr:serine hydroxymethyltransferase [Candidatus Limnocylindria bacterium]